MTFKTTYIVLVNSYQLHVFSESKKDYAYDFARFWGVEVEILVEQESYNLTELFV
jgi:hypothetical protein